MISQKKLHALPALLLACVLALSGCQSSTGSPKTDSDQTESNKGGSSSEEPGADLDGEEEEEAEIYSDKLWDRSLTEGKLALYVLRVSNDYPTDTSVSHAGDAQLLISPDGKTMLIDMNTPTNASIIVATLKKLGIKKLDYLVISHQHIDHLGGFSILFRYMEVGQIITNSHEYTGSSSYRELHKLIERYNIPYSYVYEGDSFSFGEQAQVNIYNPPVDFDYKGGTAGQNNGSLLLKIIYKDSSFLFGGDLYASQEAAILEKYADVLHVGVAKMNHHGYGTSNTREWVKAVSPKIAYGQMTGVVSDVVVGRYQALGSTLLHTALDGPFVIYTDGSDTYEVQAARDRWVETFGLNDMEDGYMVVE